jgi:hypothetical protein
LQFQEYNRNLSIMLRAGAAIKDDVRLLLALQLRLPKTALRAGQQGAKGAAASAIRLRRFSPKRILP